MVPSPYHACEIPEAHGRNIKCRCARYMAPIIHTSSGDLTNVPCIALSATVSSQKRQHLLLSESCASFMMPDGSQKIPEKSDMEFRNLL